MCIFTVYTGERTTGPPDDILSGYKDVRPAVHTGLGKAGPQRWDAGHHHWPLQVPTPHSDAPVQEGKQRS